MLNWGRYALNACSVVNSVLTSFQFILLSTEIDMNLLVVLLLILLAIPCTCARMLLFDIFLLPLVNKLSS